MGDEAETLNILLRSFISNRGWLYTCSSWVRWPAGIQIDETDPEKLAAKAPSPEVIALGEGLTLTLILTLESVPLWVMNAPNSAAPTHTQAASTRLYCHTATYT